MSLEKQLVTKYYINTILKRYELRPCVMAVKYTAMHKGLLFAENMNVQI